VSLVPRKKEVEADMEDHVAVDASRANSNWTRMKSARVEMDSKLGYNSC
jgi:hypothetical protein